MLNYEKIAKSSAESILKEVQDEFAEKTANGDSHVYHQAVIVIDVECNQIAVTVTRKDPIGIKYMQTVGGELNANEKR